MRTKSYSVALLLFDEVELLSFAGLSQVLTAAGRQWNFRPFKIQNIAEQVGPIVTREQIRVHAEHALSTAQLPEILLLPGGYGARRAADSEAVREYVGRAAAHATLIGCVGSGALILAAAGHLANCEIAATSDVASALSSIPNVTPLEVRVHASRSLLSAARAGDSIELGLAIVSKLLGKKSAETVAAALGCTWALEPLTVDLINLSATQPEPSKAD